MSKHPDNPLWDRAGDRPVSIDSQEEWDQAVESGHLTAEHVLLRLEAILEFEFGNGAEQGYDEQGFLVSLTAAGLLVEGGVKFYVYPNDHPPPHAHVWLKGDPKFNLRLRLDTGEPLDDAPSTGSARRLRRWRDLVIRHQDVLMEWWDTYHGADS